VIGAEKRLESGDVANRIDLETMFMGTYWKERSLLYIRVRRGLSLIIQYCRARPNPRWRISEAAAINPPPALASVSRFPHPVPSSWGGEKRQTFPLSVSCLRHSDLPSPSPDLERQSSSNTSSPSLEFLHFPVEVSPTH